ncbi:MAG: GldG family protein [Chthoniobacteraceae bacterium]
MKKSLCTLFYSTLGVVAVLAILLAANFLAGRVPKRLDLTAEKAYTLSAGTRAILAKLDTPVRVRFYCTRNENMPPQLKIYAQQVEDLLNEYRQASKGLVRIEKLDPEPDSDAEDSAKLDGIDPQPLSNGESLYMGLSVSLLDQKETISFLSPDRERMMEYDLSRAISRVANPEKPVIGILSSLPVEGRQVPPMLAQMGQRSQDPWTLYTELKRDYTVKQIEPAASSIPDDVKVLLVIHPRTVSDATSYAIDQFVLRGGKLIAFLDPSAVLEGRGMMGGGPGGSNLEKLLKAWGIKFNDQQTVVDVKYLGRTSRGRAPGVLSLSDEAFAKDDLVTASTSDLFMAFAGVFTGTPVEGLKETVLVKSSKDAELTEPMTAQMSPQDVIRNFAPTNTEYALAIRLSGKFKTAFPEGEPKAEADKKEAKAETPAGLKESAKDNTVILVGDTDMLQDALSVVEQANPFSGGKVMVPANGNLAFAENAIEQLSGDQNLITLRSRASRERPFTVVQQMQAAAEASYQDKIRELESSLMETQSKLGELQSRRSGDKGAQRFILSPEQQAELENFRKKEGSVKKELKELRRNLRAKTDSLENRIKWMNIALMPAAVTFAGLSLALIKRKSAK